MAAHSDASDARLTSLPSTPLVQVSAMLREPGFVSPDWLIEHVAEVARLRNRGQPAAAEALSLRIAERAVNDPPVLRQYAELAHRRADWTEADRRWAMLRAAHPANAVGYVSGVEALLRLRAFDRAEAVIGAAVDRFSDDTRVRLDWARCAAERNDRPELERRLAVLLGAFENRPDLRLHAASMLRMAGRVDAAEQLLAPLLADVAQCAPDEAAARLVEHARCATARQDGASAVIRWSAARAAAPAVESYVQGARALLLIGQATAAIELLREGRAAFPDAADLAVEHGMAWRRIEDVQEAVAVWEEVRARFPDDARGWWAAARCLRAANRLDEAAALLREGEGRFGAIPPIAVENAWAAHHRRDWPEAGRLWAAIRTTQPNNPDGFTGDAASLLLQGRPEVADELVEQALTRFPNHLGVQMQRARNAMWRRDWPIAIARLEAILAEHPNAPEVRLSLSSSRQSLRLEQAAAGVADAEPEAVRLSADLVMSTATPERRALMLRFEGLGANCEFGRVQRLAGAEPLGLMRWAGTEARKLSKMLADGIDGVGDPAHTHIIVSQDKQEYMLVDYRYFHMHTFVYVGAIDPDRLRAQMLRRLTFLKHKLIEDLADGDKLFVFQDHRDLMLVDIAAIRRGMRRYGRNRLLVVTRPGDPALDGTVELLEPGLMLGYISAMRPGMREAEYFDSWLAVCEAAAGL